MRIPICMASRYTLFQYDCEPEMVNYNEVTVSIFFIFILIIPYDIWL